MSLLESWARLQSAFRALSTGANQEVPSVPASPWSETFNSPSVPSVETLVRSVVEQIRQSRTVPHTVFELAFQPGLPLRSDPEDFKDVVSALVRHAAFQAPGGKVLITGFHRGNWLQLAVADDGAGEDALTQQGDLRSIERTVALKGGTLEVKSRAGVGTTVISRWPDIGRDRPASSAREQTEVAAPVAHEAESIR